MVISENKTNLIYEVTKKNLWKIRDENENENLIQIIIIMLSLQSL